jgi:O-antigen ligase
MTAAVPSSWIRPRNRKLVAAVCLAQVLFVVLPFFKGEAAPIIAALVLVSTVALLGSVTLAVLYLCVVAAVVPTKLFDDHLLLPMGFKFYEGLFVVVAGLATLNWLGERHLAWRRPTRLDRPLMAFLALLAFSVALGLWYGQPVSQVLRDVRYPLSYALFFVVTGFFDLKASRTFLWLLAISSAVVGVEYLGEFLNVVNLSISGSFYRVFRIEGLMLPIGTLGITALLLYDTSLHRRAFAAIGAIPVVLALVLTVGRGMWVALAFGLFLLGVLAFLEYRSGDRSLRQLGALVMIPVLVVATAFVFQRATRTGVGSVALERLASGINYEEDPSVVGRMGSYKIAVERFLERPLLGGGHGVTVTYLIPDPVEPFVLTTGQVDNVYLTILMRMGVVGFAVFVWVFVKGLLIAYRLFRDTSSPQVRQFCATFIAVYGAMLVYGLADVTMMGNRLIFWHAAFLGILARLDATWREGAQE